MVDWDKVKGLPKALEDPMKSKVSSIYSYDLADKSWDLIQAHDGKGRAIFTQPFGVIKCAGGMSTLKSSTDTAAPQKIAYMADSFWKSQNRTYPSSFITGMPTMFSVPHYSKALDAIRKEKGIGGEFSHNLVEVRPDDKVAVFEIMAGDRSVRLPLAMGLF